MKEKLHQNKCIQYFIVYIKLDYKINFGNKKHIIQ